MNLLILLGILVCTKANLNKSKTYNNLAQEFNYNDILDDANAVLADDVLSMSYLNPDFKDIQILEPYYNKLASELSKEELLIASNNLKNVQVERELFNFFASGYYNALDNKIVYMLNNALGHEFLHMSTSYVNKDLKLRLVGFEIVHDKFIVGKGLNEGFTELYNSRFFTNGNINSYKNIIPACLILELFFDNPNTIRKYYFRADLPSLIKHLERFISRDEAFCFILSLDDVESSFTKRGKTDVYKFLIKKYKENFKEENKLAKLNEVLRAYHLEYLMDESLDNSIENMNVSNFYKLRAVKNTKSTIATAALLTGLLAGSIISGNVSLQKRELRVDNLNDDSNVIKLTK